MNKEKIFTLKEVERLIKNAYNIGNCDGLEEKGRFQFRN